MRIVIFSHPEFLLSKSMPRFVRLLVDGFRQRGHQIETIAPNPRLVRLAGPASRLRKWLGYADQFIIFPIEFLLRQRRFPSDTLFVFADQALGPWVPLVAGRPHVVHCHDFLALRSARGEWPQNPTGWSGRCYQALIRRGFSRGRNFISVSHATRLYLDQLLAKPASISTTVHNGLNYPFSPMPRTARENLLRQLNIALPEKGFLLHVGGNQWYKNRIGVIALYEQYAAKSKSPLPLWMIGAPPTSSLLTAAKKISTGSVHFIINASDAQVHAAYSHATALLFPSFSEGFGWPVAEAMTCGCLVVTSDSAPMTEVGGDAAVYIPTPMSGPLTEWASLASLKVLEVVALSTSEKEEIRQRGYRQAALFQQSQAIPAYEAVYRQVLETYATAATDRRK